VRQPFFNWRLLTAFKGTKTNGLALRADRLFEDSLPGPPALLGFDGRQAILAPAYKKF
jgi:hypothetical protein